MKSSNKLSAKAVLETLGTVPMSDLYAKQFGVIEAMGELTLIYRPIPDGYCFWGYTSPLTLSNGDTYNSKNCTLPTHTIHLSITEATTVLSSTNKAYDYLQNIIQQHYGDDLVGRLGIEAFHELREATGKITGCAYDTVETPLTLAVLSSVALNKSQLTNFNITPLTSCRGNRKLKEGEKLGVVK